MKTPTLPRLLLPLLVLASVLTARAADDAVIAAVRAADDERVAATVAADPTRMNAIYSDGLNYTHSSGKFDTKKTYLDAVVSHHTVYSGYEYEKRIFRLASPDVVIMTGHAFITAGDGKAQTKHDLNIMAVWRLEGGKWRFFSWLSSTIPPPAAPAVPAVK